MKFPGSNAPNEYQLPLKVLSALHSMRAQPGVNSQSPSSVKVMAEPIRSRNNSLGSNHNNQKANSLTLIDFREQLKPNTVTNIERGIEKPYSPRIDKHRATQSTSNLHFRPKERLSQTPNSLRLSSDTLVASPNQLVQEEQPIAVFLYSTEFSAILGIRAS